MISLANSLTFNSRCLTKEKGSDFLFDDIQKSIKIILELPQSIKSITTELYALSEIKEEVIIQKEKNEYNKKVIDEIKSELDIYFARAKEDTKVLRQEIIDRSNSQIKCLEDFRVSIDTKEIDREAFISRELSKKLNDNNKIIIDNMSGMDTVLKTHSESIAKINNILVEIHNEIQSMDNSARLILLASVVSELDKSVKKNS